MTYRTTSDMVRDFELNREDAARLADCLNSFDDSDSWPGGFTHGIPFTAERVLREWAKSSSMRVLVAYTGDRIVGHCNVCHAELDPEAAYVGLLGVDPSFHGQGFGKALLIEAAQTAARAGKRRIDLHTWGGNLKAVPLYKRTGYNWVPGTRVLMESHIPGIISAPFFRRFFERYDWYDALKVNVKQEIDDIVEDGIGVFKYRFEGANGDRLLVTVDREAKGISSFDFVIDGARIALSVKPSSHTGYIGYRETEVEISLENDLGVDLEYSIEPRPTTSVNFEMKSDGHDTILSGGKAKETGVLTIRPDAVPLDREQNTWEKVKTQVECVVHLGEESISLFCGLVPVEPLAMACGPLAPVATPGQSLEVELSFTNMTTDPIRGEVRIVPQMEGSCDARAVALKMKPQETAVFPVVVQASDMPEPHLVQLTVKMYLEHENDLSLVREKILPIPVIGATGALAYEGLDNHIWLETEEYRIGISKKPPMSARLFEHKTFGLTYEGWGLLPNIGYPFAEEGSEWDRKQFDMEIKNTPQYSEVSLAADSIDRPGLHVKVAFRAHRGGGGLEQVVTLTNNGDHPIKDLGYAVGGWFSMNLQRAYVPIKGDVYCLDSIDWSGRRQLPSKPEYYQESWMASVEQDERAVVGYIWNREYLDEIRLRRGGLPRIEYRIPLLTPGQVYEFSAIRILLSNGGWHSVRSLWRRVSGVSHVPDIDTEIRRDLEFEIVPKGTRTEGPSSSLFVADKAKTRSMEFRLRLIHEEPVNAQVRLRMPSGITVDGASEIEFTVEKVGIDSPFSRPLKIEVRDGGDWIRYDGTVDIDFASRKIHEPLVAVVYDSKVKVERFRSEVQGYHVHTITAGDYQISVSPEHRGGMIRLNRVDGQSPLLDTFPEVLPFAWWERFHSGITPLLLGDNAWDWETGFSKERWTLEETSDGPWIGYTATTETRHVPMAKNVRLEVSYLLLLGTPLVKMRLKVTNESSVWRRMKMGLRGAVRPGGDVQSKVHTIVDGSERAYDPTGNNLTILASSQGAWGAFEGVSSGKILGVVSTVRSQSSLSLNVHSDTAQTVGLSKWSIVRPGSSTVLTGYLFEAESVEQVRVLSQIGQDAE
ncbi:MAG: GNAT family N-acetyltransferase [Candidatus Thorarchaeota archaeon]